MRVSGELCPVPDAAPLSRSDTEAALSAMVKDPAKLAEFEGEGEVDFSCEIEGLARLRVNAFRQRGSVALVCR
ncbi:MAG TPA: hypothetical protein VJT75_14690 [Thermoleophilaceae bacterium]|nr:hypothetical protein [Thermoleophilaceae bacterium]